MITRFYNYTTLPVAAALAIVMCGSARSAAFGAIAQENVAADVSRRTLPAAQMEPTNVGGYPATQSPGQPSVPRAKIESANEAKPGAGPKMCTEHGLPESECGICHPEMAAKLMPGQGSKVRMPAADSAKLVGVEMAQATVGDISEGIECYAELAFNQNRLAQIAAPVGGIMQSVDVDLGAKVEEKQVLAKIWSAAIAEAVAKAVLSHQTLERERKLRAERVSSEKDLQQAEAEHRAACQQLRTQGFTEDQIDVLGGLPQEQVLMEVRAPFAGEIVERSAVRGALVEAGKSLFTLTDRSAMWAMLNIPELALARVKVGQPVELRVEALPGRTFKGKLTWIAAEVDERSRMARARAEVSNPDSVLRARMFAKARILARTAEAAVLLPASAICAVEGKPFVFVKLADDLFEARAVALGVKSDGQLEVLEGLKPTETVVVNHGFALKSQWLSSRMGAGCAD
jgi:cobalt-zinc-cadmium efflux system membrane fusion protein